MVFFVVFNVNRRYDFDLLYLDELGFGFIKFFILSI